ncbi:MAG: hypothetical protein Q4Q62_07925, partial [Thermoplasmata archaeon]|nr:hypothetical protein [Thermoplasmata archaeon]
MYTNTNGAKGAEKRAKLLAAIGVLIVAIAAVALVVPTASGAEAASTAETAVLDVFTLTYNDQELDVGVSDTSVTITGFASVNAGTGVTYVGTPEIKISDASSSSYKYSVNGGTVTDITSTATAISGLSAGESFTVVVYSAYTSATDNTVYKTFTLDCSGVATQVVLASSEASGSGTSGTWSYDGVGTLTLSSYTGDLIFYKANDLTVKLVGNNVMNVQGHADDSVGGHGSGAIRASGTLTIVSGATDSTVPTLTVNQNIDGTFGLWAKSITIGDASSTAKNITITTTGGNRGIYTTGDVNIYNATVNVEGSEKAIRFGSSGTLNIDNSNVIAILDGTATTNGGTDDLYGIKGGSIDVDDKSKVTTDGMFLAGTYTNAGVVIVSGDYTQNRGAGVEYQIAGLYLSTEDAVSNLVRVANSTSATTAGYTYLVDGAIVYIGSPMSSYTVTYGTSKEIYFNDVTAVSEDITKALTGTDGTNTYSAVVLYTGASAVSSMDLTVVSGVELRIVTPTSTETNKKGEPTGTYSGTITAALTSSSTSTSVVTLTAVSGNFTVNYGSVELAGIITGTSIAVTTGDAVLAADSIVEVTTITVAKNTTLDIEGTVGKTDFATITTTINNSGSITLGDNCNISKAGIVNDDTGSVDSSTYADNVNISGGILRTSTFEVDQNVTITGDVTISGIVTVQGTLTINSGVTVTIATGGQLIL